MEIPSPTSPPTVDSQERIIREARADDAPAFLHYLAEVAGETENLTFGSEGLDMKIEQEAQFLEDTMLSRNNICLLALEGDRIIGSLTLRAGSRRRIAHIGEMGISVRHEYWGQGVGSALLVALLNWIREDGSTGIRKVNLVVREDNERAIALYRRFGFEVEGRESRMFSIDDQFIDGLRMGLVID